MTLHEVEITQHLIESFRDEAIKLMSDLIAINSVGPKNDGPGENEKADFLINYLKKYGFSDINNFAAPDPSVKGGKRPNIVTMLPGKRTDRTLWIMSHTDVVPPGDLSKWNNEPFQAVVKDGKIYGRGSEDNHQGLVSSVLAARAFIESKTKPNYNFGLVMVADEETGSHYGLSYLLSQYADLFKKEDIIIIPDAGEPDSKMIEVAEKSILWIKFKTIGKQVHASTPERGINAYRAAANLTVTLNKLHQKFNMRKDVFEPPYSTFEPTKKEANVPNINTIPGEDIFYLDCRILPEYQISEVLSEVKKICMKIETGFNVKIEIQIEQNEQAAPATPTDAAVVKVLQDSIKEVYKVDATPMGIGGGTVAAVFRRQGFDAAVWSTLDDMAHQPDEYCRIDNLINDAKVFVSCALHHILR